MPTNRTRRLPRRRATHLDDDLRQHLLTGRPFLDGFPDLASFTRAWSIHGKTLLAEFVAEHPNRRPFAWWLLDHVTERPITGTWATPAIIEQCRVPSMFGFLHTDCIGGLDWTPLQEPEADYFARLEL